MPSIEVLINAGGGKSLIQTKQKLGRGLRNPGGKTLLLVDFVDNHHGVLKRHSSRRAKIYASEGFEVVETPDYLAELRKGVDRTP